MSRVNVHELWKETGRDIQVYHQQGLIEGRRFDSQWRDLSWIPSQLQVSAEGKLIWTEMNAQMKLFGEGFPRIYNDLEAFQHILADQRFGLGFKANRDKYQADRVGLYVSAAQQLGFAAPKTQYRGFWSLLLSGFSELSWDGATFFSTSHPYRDDNGQIAFQPNLLHTLLGEGSWREARRMLTEMRRYSGDILLPTQFLTIAGPKNRGKLEEMFNADRRANGATNTLKGASKYRIEPLLTGPFEDHWFTIARGLGSDVQPVAFRETEAPSLRAILDPTDPIVRTTNEYHWILDAKWLMALLAYYCIVGSDGSQP